MKYKTQTLWVFVVLLLIVALMIAIPSSVVLLIGTISIPILVFFQAIVILKAKEQSQKKFSDGEWYEDHKR